MSLLVLVVFPREIYDCRAQRNIEQPPHRVPVHRRPSLDNPCRFLYDGLGWGKFPLPPSKFFCLAASQKVDQVANHLDYGRRQQDLLPKVPLAFPLALAFRLAPFLFAHRLSPPFVFAITLYNPF